MIAGVHVHCALDVFKLFSCFFFFFWLLHIIFGANSFFESLKGNCPQQYLKSFKNQNYSFIYFAVPYEEINFVFQFSNSCIY